MCRISYFTLYSSNVLIRSFTLGHYSGDNYGRYQSVPLFLDPFLSGLGHSPVFIVPEWFFSEICSGLMIRLETLTTGCTLDIRKRERERMFINNHLSLIPMSVCHEYESGYIL